MYLYSLGIQSIDSTLPFRWWRSEQPRGLIAFCPYPLTLSASSAESGFGGLDLLLSWQRLASEWHTLDCYTVGNI